MPDDDAASGKIDDETLDKAREDFLEEILDLVAPEHAPEPDSQGAMSSHRSCASLLER
jgi:hypothetical protein